MPGRDEDARPPGGRYEIQPRKATPTENKSQVPTCTVRDGAKLLRRGREACKSGRGLPKKGQNGVSLWDRHSKSVNTQESLLCSQPNKCQEITVRAPQIWLFRTQIFWLIKPRISVS